MRWRVWGEVEGGSHFLFSSTSADFLLREAELSPVTSTEKCRQLPQEEVGQEDGKRFFLFPQLRRDKRLGSI